MEKFWKIRQIFRLSQVFFWIFWFLAGPYSFLTASLLFPQAWVYCFSKYLMWFWFKIIVSRASYFSCAHARLTFMDTGEPTDRLMSKRTNRWTNGQTGQRMNQQTRTNGWTDKPSSTDGTTDGPTLNFFLHFFSLDSLMISYQRNRTDLERYEMRQLLKLGGATPFHETYIGQRMAQHYISIYGYILDYSSLGEVGPIFE